MNKLFTVLLVSLLLLSGCTAGTAADPTNVDLASDDEVIIMGATDTTTHSIVCIDIVHKEIHEGHHFYIEGFVTLQDTDTLYVKLVTPDNTAWAHFTWNIESNGVIETYFYEDATGGMTGGVNVTPLNNNRNSLNTSGLVITRGVTYPTDNGTMISAKKVGAVGFKEVVGGAADRTNELVLKQNTTYFREFISGSDGNIIAFRASWYEYANKEP